MVFPDRGTFKSRLVRLRGTVAPNERLSASVFAQYNSVARLALPTLRLRNRFSEGRDLYLTYDELISTERESPEQSRSLERGFVIKYSHAIER